MIAITKRFFLLSPLLMLARKAFAQSEAPKLTDAAMAAMVAKAVTGYILPAYQDLIDTTAGLAAAMERSCAAPGTETTEKARSAFKAVLLAWAKVDFLRFGPIAEQGRLERFSFIPDKHGTGARQLRQILATPNPALLEPDAVAKLSAAVQGMTALESLLFVESNGGETADYRCQLSLRIAENLNQIATETLAGWTKTGGWAQLMAKPGGSNIVYRDGTEPVVEILKAIVTGLQQMRDQRLLPALGKSFATAKPNQGAYVKSGLAMAYLQASGKALESLIETSDFFGLAGDAGPKLAAATKTAMADFEGSIAIDGSWQQAFQTEAGYDRMRHAFDVLKTIEDIFNYQFTAAAGISPGFNALDGD